MKPAGGGHPAGGSGSANEVAVNAFLENRIRFTAIAPIISRTMASHTTVADPALEDIIGADRWARETAVELVS
jgi:1-deoxy-D-xylulose-5-phosphate reductoisomerase